MRRRSVWLAVAVAALVAVAAPASAASVASINTTDADFQQGSLTGFTVSGTGEGASAVAELGTRETFSVVATGDGSFSANKAGVLFELSAEREQLRAEVSNTANSRVQLYDHDANTLLATATPDGGGTVVINQSLDAGTTYRLVADDQGAGREYHDSSDSLPATNGALTVTAGYFGGSEESGTVYAFDTISTGYRHSVEYRGDEHQAEADTLFADVDPGGGSATIRAQSNDGTGWSDVATTTVSSAQNVSLDISTDSADRYRTIVEATSVSAQTVTLEDEGVTFGSSGPALSNPDPADGANINSYDGTVSVDINDSDFALAQGDRVTVVASDASGQIGEQDVTQNDTVSFNYGLAIGGNNITWTATDEYGNSDTLQQNFTTPEGLEIRNASNTSQLVDSAEVTIDFYNDTRKITKTTNSGIVSFAGLNEQDKFVVQVNASGYNSRRVLLDDLVQQQAVYLVPENETTVDVRFTLQDNTGRFQAEETDFILRRGLNVSGDTTYKRVAGDRFGATQTLEFNLAVDERYRLVVRNSRGDTRELGGVTITRAETIPVQIGALDFSIQNESTYQINTSQPTSGGVRELTFVYQDPRDRTSSLDLRIHERGNVSNTLATYDRAGSFGTIKIVEPTTDTNTSYVANVTFVRGGEEFSAVVPYGAQQYPLGVGLDSGWQSIISVGLILVVGGLFSAGNIKVGALVVPGIAGVLWFVGWMGGVATAGAIVLAFSLGIGYNLIYGQGVV